ncbi:MAG TPA: DUF4079 domain-containing protein [Desulfobulbaceae bacterium]|nr:DUF4079 domain-containing protein [Desulfobulbaceae bacterium]
MLIIHPILQSVTTLLALYVLLLGAGRFRRLHLRQRSLFKWQRHVWLGTVTLLLWFFGLVFGLVMVKVYWHGFFITGNHGKRLVIFLPLLLFGLISGWYMHTHKKKRIILPLIHGSANLLLIILALLQAKTGWQVYKDFVLGQ